MKHIPLEDMMVEQLREDPAFAEAYLRVAFEDFQKDGDMKVLLGCLRHVIEARADLNTFAQSIDIPHASMYQMLSAQSTPSFSTMVKICGGLGYDLTLSKKVMTV